MVLSLLFVIFTSAVFGTSGVATGGATSAGIRTSVGGAHLHVSVIEWFYGLRSLLLSHSLRSATRTLRSVVTV